MSLQLGASGGLTGNTPRHDAPAQVGEVSEGQVLLGKFRVERVLGVGGMGAVVAAHHLQLDTRVAIKFLLQCSLSNAEAVSRFSREARAAARITSEHVARVFDVGTLDSGAPYMVMEYLNGFDLSTWLERQGPLDSEDAVEFVLQACEAVAEAHALGIIHRDLKPSNLFCVRRADGRRVIKVLDFGISRISSLGLPPQDMRVTSDVLLMGTPLYMSPEQIAGSPIVNAQADIWALGVILYELLTAKMPFGGETLPEVWAQITTQAPPSLRRSLPFLPDGLEAAIFRCLEKDRHERYGNVAELAAALQAFGPERSGTSVRRISEIIRGAGLAAEPLRTLPEHVGAEITVHKIRTTPILETTQTTGKKPEKSVKTIGATARAGRVSLGSLGGLSVLAVVALISFARVARTRQAGAAAAALAPESAAASHSAPNDPSPGGPSVNPAKSPSEAVGWLPANAEQGAPKPGLAALDRHETRRTSAPARLGATLTPTALTVFAPGTGAAAVKPDCSTPFTLDDQGRKHFKSECWAVPAPVPVRSSPSAPDHCDPAFDFDDQGRKHFKPECFLNAK